jgi:hypothetical protein
MILPGARQAKLAHDEKALEWYTVLKEEHERLGGGAIHHPPDRYAGDHITDVVGLASYLINRHTALGDPIDLREAAAREVCASVDERKWKTLGELCESDEPSLLLIEQAREILVEALNVVVDGQALAKYLEEARIPLKRLDPFVHAMLARKDVAEVAELNRRLLDAAFPAHLASFQDIRLCQLYRGVHKERRAAICLSGGGIRSATFALGVVQALARSDLLHRFTYMSTVSGGGYLGAWLSAWATHTRFEQVLTELGSAPTTKLDTEAAPVRHLRTFSNYLSPRLGFLSADTWTVAATYLRNLLLVWIVLVPLLAGIAMVPLIAKNFVAWNPLRNSPANGWPLFGIFLTFGFLLGATAVRFVHRYRPEGIALPEQERAMPREDRDQSNFLKRCLLPLCLSTVLLTTAWVWLSTSGVLPDVSYLAVGRWPTFLRQGFYSVFGAENAVRPYSKKFYLTASFFVFGAMLHFVGWLVADRPAPRRKFRDGVNIIITGGLVGFLAYPALTLITKTGDRWSEWYVTAALPVCLSIAMASAQLYTGLASKHTEDPEREWSARYSAWILIVAVTWFVTSSLILLAPFEVSSLTSSQLVKTNLTGIVSGIITLFLAQSPYSGRRTAEEPHSASWTDVAKKVVTRYGLAIAAPLFAAFLLVMLSLGDQELLQVAAAFRPVGNIEKWALALLLALGLLAFGFYMSIRIDTNRFSLHAMYRARIIRAFLGASRPSGERKPDPFTGFDENDNVPMNALWPAAEPPGKTPPPIHVVNMALNLVSGEKLAWQERKAASFTVSSLHAGSTATGYRRTSAPPNTSPVSSQRLYGGKPISLGTAVTISGAAASPNMGYHSSPAVTFLMTLFNMRLGWWLGNPGPRGDNTFFESAPKSALRPVIDEMFGFTNASNDYVYLSDGGHFENLGLYEMVQRRCKLILVCDAGADVRYSFDDLGNAIRKIRIDLGIPIEFADGFSIQPRAKREISARGKYWAKATIRYSCVDKLPSDKEADSYYDGTLIYIKPTFYGDEPRDVFNYAVGHPDFPHESTMDQFFSESQFESYRALGSHIVNVMCTDLAELMPAMGVETERRFGIPDWKPYKTVKT